MHNVWWIFRRDLGSQLGAPMGYIILTAALALHGLFFNTLVVGTGNMMSEEVLSRFFFFSGGVNATAAVFVAMRLIAEERQLGTLTLLSTSTVRDYQLVLGKFLSGLAFITVLTLMTLYLPMLILINGKISVAHLFAGYLGMLLFSAAVLALGLLCSAIAPNQLVALVLGALVVLLFILFWFIAKVASPPFEDVIAYLSLHDKHFRPFMRGLVSIKDIVFYVTLIYVALVAATRALEARRWQ
jgi:ABC-2 type transport system permease protein